MYNLFTQRIWLIGCSVFMKPGDTALLIETIFSSDMASINTYIKK